MLVVNAKNMFRVISISFLVVVDRETALFRHESMYQGRVFIGIKVIKLFTFSYDKRLKQYLQCFYISDVYSQ